MRSTPTHRWITALVVAAVFVTGIGVGQFTQHEARAQSLSTATLYVPAGGLVFRAPDGSPLARLSRDAHGGTFELFDDRQGVSMRVPHAQAEVSVAPNTYEIDNDPFSR